MFSKLIILSLCAMTISAATIQEDAGVNADNVFFYLYNTQAQHGGWAGGKKLVVGDDSTFQNTGIAANEQTIVLIHGFLQDYRCGFPQDIKDLYLAQNKNINVITVDYAKIACYGYSEALAPFCYPSASNGIGTVGQKVVDLLTTLKNKGLVNPSNVRVVGVSLGAHVAGHVGSKFEAATGVKLARITALDPAGPLFTCGSGARCLNKNDATFVDVIHSDMGNLGNTRAMGDIDFYPNGGEHPQPTCEGQATSCSHSAAAKYWMRSIGKSDIQGHKCDSYVHLTSGQCNKGNGVLFGDSAKAGATGNHYLQIQPVEFSGRYTCYV